MILPMNRISYLTKDLVSVDIETSGPNPGQYSLLAIGACTFIKPQSTFYVELKPVNTNAMAEALAVSDLSMDRLKEDGLEPAQAMQRFEDWLKASLPLVDHPLFVGFNAPFDWMFINDYFHRYLGHNPFGHSALDIKSFFMGLKGVTWSKTSMEEIGSHYKQGQGLTHHALHDAMDQAELFRKMLSETHQR